MLHYMVLHTNGAFAHDQTQSVSFAHVQLCTSYILLYLLLIAQYHAKILCRYSIVRLICIRVLLLLGSYKRPLTA